MPILDNIPIVTKSKAYIAMYLVYYPLLSSRIGKSIGRNGNQRRNNNEQMQQMFWFKTRMFRIQAPPDVQKKAGRNEVIDRQAFIK